MDPSFADVNTSSAPKRPYTAPLLNDDQTTKTPQPGSRGRSLDLEHEIGLAGGLLALCASRAELGREGVAERSADGYRNYNSRMRFPPAIIPRFTLTPTPPGCTLNCAGTYQKTIHENRFRCP